ncbi:Protein of unknown function [Pyronema omphalodes CBS 100304]|uniref:Uncharacterized protein n=1 Tax=Pyronema omphalodes (strain CBS 100304) TaxID=1076935 RepID=U4L0V0_PYROM|nr:Protein of unknown function [Pyronema omphalodes CBS 100304]
MAEEITIPYFIILFLIMYFLIQREERIRPCKSLGRLSCPPSPTTSTSSRLSVTPRLSTTRLCTAGSAGSTGTEATSNVKQPSTISPAAPRKQSPSRLPQTPQRINHGAGLQTPPPTPPSAKVLSSPGLKEAVIKAGMKDAGVQTYVRPVRGRGRVLSPGGPGGLPRMSLGSSGVSSKSAVTGRTSPPPARVFGKTSGNVQRINPPSSVKGSGSTGEKIPSPQRIMPGSSVGHGKSSMGGKVTPPRQMGAIPRAARVRA